MSGLFGFAAVGFSLRNSVRNILPQICARASIPARWTFSLTSAPVISVVINWDFFDVDPVNMPLNTRVISDSQTLR